jgi:hypothetical protein
LTGAETRKREREDERNEAWLLNAAGVASDEETGAEGVVTSLMEASSEVEGAGTEAGVSVEVEVVAAGVEAAGVASGAGAGAALGAGLAFYMSKKR